MERTQEKKKTTRKGKKNWYDRWPAYWKEDDYYAK